MGIDWPDLHERGVQPWAGRGLRAVSNTHQKAPLAKHIPEKQMTLRRDHGCFQEPEGGRPLTLRNSSRREKAGAGGDWKRMTLREISTDTADYERGRKGLWGYVDGFKSIPPRASLGVTENTPGLHAVLTPINLSDICTPTEGPSPVHPVTCHGDCASANVFSSL